EYLLGGATSASSFPVPDDPIGRLSGNFEAPQVPVCGQPLVHTGRALGSHCSTWNPEQLIQDGRRQTPPARIQHHQINSAK
ncbi:hypothetical protein ACH4YO_42780, partial [Streptomyces noursei]|uniref:hypothetical protein n=1 Tax=Streptomyces noursei TaxID=1971 RepID=UPI00379CE301